jgi:integrase
MARPLRIEYEAALYHVTARAGKLAGVELRPHDLRRHAAKYASMSGVPIEIVSKIILRHANLPTTQRYLGKNQRPQRRQSGLRTCMDKLVNPCRAFMTRTRVWARLTGG